MEFIMFIVLGLSPVWVCVHHLYDQRLGSPVWLFGPALGGIYTIYVRLGEKLGEKLTVARSVLKVFSQFIA